MSAQHKVWIDAALNDLAAAIYLHEGRYWFHATLEAQQAGEKFGKAILIFSGVPVAEIKAYSHRVLKINERIEQLGLHRFSEIEQNKAMEMQKNYTNLKYPDEQSEDPPYILFGRIGSEDSIQWAVNYLDMMMSIIPDVITENDRDGIKLSFLRAKEIANTCKKCNANPCVCDDEQSGCKM